MNATATRRPTIRLIELQVAEVEAEPRINYQGKVVGDLPAHFTQAIDYLYDAGVREHGVEVCDCCHHQYVGWTYDGGVRDEADYRWHYTVLVTTDGGQTIKTMCEECSGDIGPEIIFV